MQITGILITNESEQSPGYMWTSPERKRESDLFADSSLKATLTPEVYKERSPKTDYLRFNSNTKGITVKRRPKTAARVSLTTSDVHPSPTPTFNNKSIRVLKVKEDKMRNTLITNIQDSLIQNLSRPSGPRSSSLQAHNPQQVTFNDCQEEKKLTHTSVTPGPSILSNSCMLTVNLF